MTAYKHWLLTIFLVLLFGTAYGQLLFQNGNSFGAYNFDGTLINPDFISSGLSNPQGIAISGRYIYVADNPGPSTNGKIVLYNLDGTLINPSLISGVQPAGIAINGTNLYVANTGNTGTVGVYNLDGTAINTSLITGVIGANGIAISGTNLFVAYLNYIGKYGLDGTVINARFISGLKVPAGLAISGTNIYVVEFLLKQIRKFDLNGTMINASLISSSNGVFSLPNGIAINGNILYVQCAGSKTVGEYYLDGTPINTAFISGLTNPPSDNYGILVLPPPKIQTISSSFSPEINGFEFSFVGISNQTVTIESCSNLTSSTWTSIQTNVLIGCPSYFSDPEWTNFPSRFYRVLVH